MLFNSQREICESTFKLKEVFRKEESGEKNRYNRDVKESKV